MQQAPGVWRITTPLPFRPREVHAYLVELHGGEWMLVDGGMDSASSWAALDEGVRAHTPWNHIRLHVVTHMHMDHIGLAARIRTASGAPLAMGKLDAERSTHAALHPNEEAEYRAALFRENGLPPGMLERLEQRGPTPTTEPLRVQHLLGGLGGDLPLAAGWRWIWTPGHTAGHMALFRPADRVLIAGDAVLPRITPTIGVNRQRSDPVGDYLDALTRLEALQLACILPGHGEPITRPAERLAELHHATLAESLAIGELLSGRPVTAWDVARQRYPDRELPPSAWVQALRETLAHLQHLVAAGKARRELTSRKVLCFALA